MSHVVDRVSATPGVDVVIKPLKRDEDPSGWETRRRWRGRAFATAGPLLILCLWQLASSSGWIDERTFSSPAQVYFATIEMAQSGALLEHLGATGSRISLGYVVGAAFGVVLGLLVGWSDLVRRASRPTLSALYTVPKLGIYPLLLLTFGLGETAKIVLVGISTFLIVVLATIDAVSQVPTSYIEAAKSLNASRLTIFLEVVVPASLSRIFTSLRLGIGHAILVVIGTEMVSSNDGIGYLLWSGWNLFRAEQMFVGIILSALLGVVATALVSAVERLSMPWHREGQRVLP